MLNGSLFLDLFERLGLFALLFILLLRFDAFKRLITGKATLREKVCLSLHFGISGVIATLAGFPVQGALANLRGVPVALAGILGGPLVGFSAGLVAGIHRYLFDLAGLTSLSCAIATLLQGVTAHFVYQKIRRSDFDPLAAFAVGVLNEMVKMGLILLLVSPYDVAFHLVSLLVVPSVVVNAAGISILLQLVASVYREKERAMADQAQMTLAIAFKVLPRLRDGLTASTAEETARVIHETTGIDSVLISTPEGVLASAGRTCFRHSAGSREATCLAVETLATGHESAAPSRRDIGCSSGACPLGSGISVPLKLREIVVGTLELYRAREGTVSPLDGELARGLSLLFSNQLEVGEIEKHRKLLADAEIRTLQAQINPHFLFNAISTIRSYTRTDPAMAGDLLVRLADFFRRNINDAVKQVPISLELEHCEAYLAIEKARFEDRIRLVYDIDSEALGCLVPSLILQPLVENAVRHGILAHERGGEMKICILRDGRLVRISVRDDGIGMFPEKVASLLSSTGTCSAAGLGIGVKNVHNRLVALYGPDSGLSIASAPGAGTEVSFTIPAAA